ncbi:MAG: fibronectin type III domain-containing protein [Bacteroidales bacterium]|nr:fibronectin type III domain-containing protein [Bacteroidales bacterium]
MKQDSTTTLSFYDNTLTAETSYNYHVTAIDQAGNESAASNTIAVSTPATPDVEAPSAPSNLHATDTAPASTTINWNAATDNVGVSKYLVYRNGVVINSTSLLNFADDNLLPETSYSYYVKARDIAGNIGNASNTINVTTPAAPDTEAPGAPANLVANEVTTTSITLNWDAATDNVGVIRYVIYRNSTKIDSTTQLNFIDKRPGTGDFLQLLHQGPRPGR